MDNISLRYFKTQLKASTKQLGWHDTLALLDVELIHKLRHDNVVSDALNRKGGISSGKNLNQDSNIKGHLPRGAY